MLSDQQKHRIVYLIEMESSIRKTEKELNIPYSTTRDFISKYKKTNSIFRRKGSGRPKLFNPSQIRVLVGIKEIYNTISPYKLID